jgi:hypothetical protein
MKNKITIILSVISIGLFARCTGNHSSHNGGDTAEHHYNVPSNVDTSKTTTSTGGASTLDNSGSGGTKTAKDTTHKADSNKK